MVYLLGQNPLPDLTLMNGQPCNLVSDGPNGWSRFIRTADGGPNAGKTICAVIGSTTEWVYLDPADKTTNGQWAIVQGASAAFNPEPGGPVRWVAAVEIPNA